MDHSRYRLVITGLALALAAVVALVVAFLPSGDDPALPEPLEAVFPLPGDAVVRQTVVQIDLPVGYEAALVVDGRSIPAVEIGVTPATGVRIWQPAPGGVIPEWSPGEHTVTVTWDRTTGRPDPGEFTWTFRVG